jgi:hypothetical protein
MRVRAISLREANAFVAHHHRHHKPVQGHRYSLSVWEGNRLAGVAIIGRPVGRKTPQDTVLEVTRLCTDGTKNACSTLYAAAARAGRELGYERIQTFILDAEPGTSLRAAGWTPDGLTPGRQWDYTTERQMRLDGRTRRTDQPIGTKQRWVRCLL